MKGKNIKMFTISIKYGRVARSHLLPGRAGGRGGGVLGEGRTSLMWWHHCSTSSHWGGSPLCRLMCKQQRICQSSISLLCTLPLQAGWMGHKAHTKAVYSPATCQRCMLPDYLCNWAPSLLWPVVSLSLLGVGFPSSSHLAVIRGSAKNQRNPCSHLGTSIPKIWIYLIICDP